LKQQNLLIKTKVQEVPSEIKGTQKTKMVAVVLRVHFICDCGAHYCTISKLFTLIITFVHSFQNIEAFRKKQKI
jgi:hypothetical protein